MAFDALLRRYFTAVVLVLVALVALFQAKAAAELVGAALGVDENSLVTTPTAHAADLNAQPKAAGKKSAEPIIARNPFDSVTGPLYPKPADSAGGGSPGKLDLSNPLAAPACDGIRVAIVTESPDREWSIAALQGPGEPGPKLRRVGDEVNGKQVVYIGFNPERNSPSVWITSDSMLCQALLFATQPAPQPAAGPAPPPSAAPPPAPGGPTAVPADIASKIQKVSDTEFNVDRSVVDKVLENQAELMKSARIVPEQKDGKVVGIRLFGVRPDTLLGTLGFQNGDRLESINGFNMASPEKALEAYARLRTAASLDVKINRRGQPVSLDYRIK